MRRTHEGSSLVRDAQLHYDMSQGMKMLLKVDIRHELWVLRLNADWPSRIVTSPGQPGKAGSKSSADVELDGGSANS